MISFGSQRDDSDPEVVILPHDENELDLKQYLYEFIHLALPIRKTHPDNADGGTSCDPEMIEKLREHLVDERHSDDPRWEDLKKLMKNN
jgi:uncharacterized metal-binding protein YceD (DUF177 family)